MASVEDFDEIEFQAARTGNHVRAAVRMSELAQQAEPGLRAESHLRAGEQWMIADDPQRAADEFRRRDRGRRRHLRRPPGSAGPGAARPRPRRRGRRRCSRALTADRDAVTPRTCDLLAELFTEQGDLRGALDWATSGVERCIQLGDDAELQLLLRLRYRIRWTSASTRTITTTCWTRPTRLALTALPADRPAGLHGQLVRVLRPGPRAPRRRRRSRRTAAPWPACRRSPTAPAGAAAGPRTPGRTRSAPASPWRPG